MIIRYISRRTSSSERRRKTSRDLISGRISLEIEREHGAIVLEKRSSVAELG